MNRTLLASISFLCAMTSVAHAGFQWNPPADVSSVQQPRAQAQPAPMPSYAAPQVITEPVIAPVQGQMPQQQIAMPKSKGGLYIDPYPLKNTDQSMTDTSLTDMALIEQGGGLNAVQLGNGMNTGVKPHNAPRRMVQLDRPIPRAPIGNDGMTPIPGGEPAPLSSVEKAYLAPQPVMPPRIFDENNRAPNAINNDVKYANAVGFGRDLPLVLALGQVIPQDYSHAFAMDVDAGATVSWEGGKPWNIILNEMLAAKNMMAVIRGKQVTIQPLATL